MEPNTFQMAWIWFAALTLRRWLSCTPEDAHVDYCLEAIVWAKQFWSKSQSLTPSNLRRR